MPSHSPQPTAMCIVALGLLWSCPAASAGDVRLGSVKLERPVIELYERCELTIDVEGAVENPYDPEEVAVEATFQPPSGEPVTVPGFFYQPFERVREAGHELLRPVGEPVWKVRFTPRRPGRWSYEVRLRTPRGTQSAPGEPVQVNGSQRPGFLHVDRDSGYFRFSNGQSFLPIGENLCWGPSFQPLKAYDRWFQDLVRQRANYFRLWMAPWFLRLETKETGVGRYDQARAWQLDYLLEQSESLGLYMQLCLLNHGSFSRTQDPDWHNNPYNEALGGMCRLPNDFLTQPKAKDLFQRQLRYLVSRWGYSPNLAVWELFNEADFGEFNAVDLTPWVARMSAWLHANDVNQRPVTISFHRAEADEIWRLPTIDMIQLHEYEQRDFASVLGGPTIAKLSQTFGKPVMVGEFGWITEVMRQLDDAGIHMHDALWASLMGRAVGSALIWYWDLYVHPNQLEGHFRPLAMFWHGEPLESRMEPLDLSLSDGNLVGLGIGSRQRAYFWIKNRSHNVDEYVAYRCALAKQRLGAARGQSAVPVRYPPHRIRSATITVRGLDWVGRYRLEWWDPYHGRLLAQTVNVSSWGTLTAAVPELTFDVAGKLIKLRWWERG